MKITIIKTEDRGWFVGIDERFCDQLEPDEALGVVAAAIMEGKGPPYLHTEEEWKARAQALDWSSAAVDLRKGGT